MVKAYPFTIRLVDRLLEESSVQLVEVKIDPGSKETEIAVVRKDEQNKVHALAFFCLEHRGEQIHRAMEKRSNYRRRRRSANLCYRAPRFNNRKRAPGWLPPSLQHRVDTVFAWAKKLRKLFPVSGLVLESVKFDAQKMQNPEIQGIEYQRGTLFETEAREYLLAKFEHRCAYCGAQNVPLNIDHAVPRAKGGSNRISNLVLACVRCNQKKGAKSLDEFLKKHPETLAKIKRQLKAPLKDAAAVNATRNAILRELKTLGLPLETGSGALTKFNRKSFGIPKEHWLDALYTGEITGADPDPNLSVLRIKCTGRGQYSRTIPDKHGSPKKRLMRQKRVHGFATGDMVEARVTKGKKAGYYKGRVTVKLQGYFDITWGNSKVTGIAHRFCRLISVGDGYGYTWQRTAPIPPRFENRGFLGGNL